MKWNLMKFAPIQSYEERSNSRISEISIWILDIHKKNTLQKSLKANKIYNFIIFLPNSIQERQQ